MSKLHNNRGITLTEPRFISTVKYSCVVIDPPWPITWVQNSYTGCALPYERMSVQQIGCLPITQLLTEDAWVFLWTTCSFLESAFSILRQWGLQYRQIITWNKSYGMGRPPLTATEHCLMAAYGEPSRPHIKGPAIFNHFTTQEKTAHSVKPEKFFDLINSFAQGTNLEMFARKRRNNWDAWGNEINNTEP